MIDFLMISTRSRKRGSIEIYPKFIIKKSSDLMIRGGDFYAVWLEDIGMWSTDEQDALQLIDRELDKYAAAHKNSFETEPKVLHMWDAESGMIDSWHKYCQKQMRDSFHMLDEKIIFSNSSCTKKDYASKKLDYPLEKGELRAYNKLMTTLYSDEERQKLEWAIGSIVSGDSKDIQKFIVLYGSAGTGKSTVLNIIQQLFEGYYSVFDAKALGSSSNSFALEAFKTNPLVAIQHDGDLSHIEDNSRINSLVSHELMTVNEKFRSTYSNRFKCFLFMGSNKPVKITDAKSGLIRRLIDVSPTGNKLPSEEYREAVGNIPFELGAIAYHCLQVYKENRNLYDNYIPIAMLGASNDFYNFVLDSYFIFEKDDGITMKAAWDMYKKYCEDAKINYPFSQRIFKEELKNYFYEYKERFTLTDGTRVRSYYSGFRTDRFEPSKAEPSKDISWLCFKEQSSLLDSEFSSYPAQYANADGKPTVKWDNVKTSLKDIDTHRTHYLKVPEYLVVVDLDLKDESGNKSLALNMEDARKFPPTYAEVSNSGNGIHLHYIYTGDVKKLSKVYDDNIEVKVYLGKSSLRRRLTKCNDIPIAHINSGLPLKGEQKMVNPNTIQSEKRLRNLIKRILNKEIHPDTTSSVNFIFKILEDAYESGMHYDVSDMQNAILAFAANATNQSEHCVKTVSKMKFRSDDASEPVDSCRTDKLVFFDIEVFPNLFILNWKLEGENSPVVRMINPSSEDIEELTMYKLVGFNCRRYDNHILYARMLGYSIEGLYKVSQNIILDAPNCFFGEAYNISYTDVYDFCSKKQSLKKWEIELGIHHQELGLPWDKPVPQELWTKVAEYCDNDVLATEAVFNARKSDFVARQVLADVAGMSVNDTTNSLTTRIIFGKDREPQDSFNYRDLGNTKEPYDRFVITEDMKIYTDMGDEFTVFNDRHQPVFPGYVFENGKSTYREEEVGEGGYVYAEPGMYGNVALLDIASMHPSSIVAENLFGDKYTKRFKDILEARIAIKHKDFDSARKMLGGALAKYLTDESSAADLAQALKIAINSVYGLTSAGFKNPFRDPRNKDNIVAKRGALFMINLKHEVQSRGFTVVHIKTDSIKIADATPEIIEFVSDYGKMYGYNFEHEATYDKICLVNDAVYIARYKDGKHAGEWTATGTQFQVPYVFKTLFSKEDILFEDMCETKSVSTSIYLDMNEALPDVTMYENELAKALKADPDSELIKELEEKISHGHNYIFVGKVGSFCPVKPGSGGGVLYREKDGKYYAVTGTKGYRWLEAEMAKTLGKESCIDISYYEKMVDEARKSIMKYGDIDWFVSDETYDEYIERILPF